MRTAMVSLFLVGITATASVRVRAADQYELDTTHASVTFMISHIGLSETHGRFNTMEGNFSIDSAKPADSRFSLTIDVASIDTNNKKRDDHLRSPDFFNAKQYPTLTFESTSVKPIDGGYEVTGNLTLHGVTKPVRFAMQGGKTAEFPQGTFRTGFTTALAIKRSDFGMNNALEAIGDDVRIAISFEGIKK